MAFPSQPSTRQYPSAPHPSICFLLHLSLPFQWHPETTPPSPNSHPQASLHGSSLRLSQVPRWRRSGRSQSLARAGSCAIPAPASPSSLTTWCRSGWAQSRPRVGAFGAPVPTFSLPRRGGAAAAGPTARPLCVAAGRACPDAGRYPLLPS
ncbi:unnamed protein product [Urochloa humidicola]